MKLKKVGRSSYNEGYEVGVTVVFVHVYKKGRDDLRGERGDIR